MKQGSEASVTGWDFLTNHAHVLTCVAHDPGIRLRDIAAAVGITERAAHRILSELVEEGYVLRERRATKSLPGRAGASPAPSPRPGREVGDLLGAAHVGAAGQLAGVMRSAVAGPACSRLARSPPSVTARR